MLKPIKAKLALMFAALTVFMVSGLAQASLIGGVLAVIIGGTMAIVGAYVVFTINEAIGHSSQDITDIYEKVMKGLMVKQPCPM